MNIKKVKFGYTLALSLVPPVPTTTRYQTASTSSTAQQAAPAKPAPPSQAPPYKPDFVIPNPDTGTTTPTSPTTPIGPAPPSYVIGAQDLLRVTVFDEPELSSTYRVESDGMLSFPLINRIPASGLTLREFQERLTTQLANGYIKSPQVRVEIDQYKSQSVFVMGEVRTPGKVTMSGSMTLLEALAQAGSPTAAASTEVTILHPKNPNATAAQSPTDVDPEGDKHMVNRSDLQSAQAFVLRDGDIVTVPKAQTFYISGQVRNPGSYVLSPSMTVQQALAVAGGLNERGTDRGIKANRLVNGKRTEVTLKLEDKVKADDTLVVPNRLF